MKTGTWAIYRNDTGHRFEDGVKSPIATHFEHNVVVQIVNYEAQESLIYNIKRNERFIVASTYLEAIDVFKTGKGFNHKICNKCFVLQPISAFDVNQTDAKGRKTTRPSCKVCRLDIDKRLLKSAEIATFKQKYKPKEGSLFRCPICEKRGIVNVTVKIVLDHDKAEGKIRSYICDSCNTGLGRFKNGKNYLKNAMKYIEAFKRK
ncbi:MAG: Hpy99I family type II restriction endonuclease [Cytophagales bacterium]